MRLKVDVLIFKITCPKPVVLGNLCMFDLLPFFFPSFLPRKYEKSVANKRNKKYNISWRHFFAMFHWHLQRKNLLCLSHCKTHRTIPIDNVGLKIGLWGPQVPWSLLQFFVEVVLGWVQWPITYYRGARDDFMVYDVNNPLMWHHFSITYMLSPVKKPIV